MARIYNKKILFPNGTLIDNWFEEDELRKQTGEGRTIPKAHFPKKAFDFENPIHNPNPKDDTQKRVIGERMPDPSYRTLNKTYGDFSHPEYKYMHPQLKQKETDHLFDEYAKTTLNFKNELEKTNADLRIQDSTYRSLHVAQPFEKNLGRRHMFTPSGIPIPKDRPDKLFMAQHKMNKFPEILSNFQQNQYVDKYIPHYNDKEITFWSMNIDKGNTYHTFMLGTNPFGRSHAFTQPIQKTRGQTQYYGNNKNLSSARNIYLNPEDEKYYNDYKESVEKEMIVEDISPIIKEKLLKSCMKKGWIGLRSLKIYLRSLKKNKSEEIDKSDFKFFTAKNCVIFDDKEIEFLFNKFDKEKKNFINFIETLNYFRNVNEYRKDLIVKFKDQVLGNNKFISLNALEKMANMNFHPEAMNFLKTEPEITKEYSITWDNLREDDLIKPEDFMEYFYDVSSCVEKDEDFAQILKACGFKN